MSLLLITGSGIAAVIILWSILPVFTSNNTGFSTLIDSKPGNGCGTFHVIPENKHNPDTVKVLLMNNSSTVCARLNFTIWYMNNNTSSGLPWPQMADMEELLHIGKYNISTTNKSYSIGYIDQTSLFQIHANPKTVSLAGMPLDSNFTVIYTIKPLQNATGFYDYFLPEINCERYPLAVGYDKDQVNASDFSSFVTNPPLCESSQYHLTSVEIAGMNYKEITFPVK
ncbi:MAG: hypothetical protein WCC52_01030 [Nitrosotalea sp.]